MDSIEYIDNKIKEIEIDIKEISDNYNNRNEFNKALDRIKLYDLKETIKILKKIKENIKDNILKEFETV